MALDNGSPGTFGCSVHFGGTCGVDVAVEPTGPGYRYALGTDSNGVNYMLRGYGAPTTPVLFFSPQIMNFGRVAVGQSATLTLTIENGSQLTENFNYAMPTFTTGTTNDGEFSSGPYILCGVNSSASMSGITNNVQSFPTRTVSITFTPRQSYALRQTTLTVTDTTGFSTSMLVEGTGSTSVLGVPLSVSFGNVQLGSSTTQAVTVALANGDPVMAQIVPVTGAQPFSIPGATSCAQGATSCQVCAQQFAPLGTGTFKRDNDGD